MSAPSLFATNRAAGCGGTTQCTAISAVHSGIASFSNEVLVFLAIEKASGINSTTPTSTNSVIPQISPTRTIMTSADSQRQRCSVRPMRSAAPDTSIILPRMVPRPITAARKPSVPPMPLSMALTISNGPMPIIVPTKKLANSSARNGWNLNFTMVKTINTMLISSVLTTQI